MMSDDTKRLTGRGGPRPGAGRPTRYPGKQPFSVSLTPVTIRRLRKAARHHRASVSDVIEAAARSVPLTDLDV